MDEDFSLIIQEFLEQFRNSEDTDNSYCYGLGQHDPLSPFLFRYPLVPNISLFLEGPSIFDNSLSSTNTLQNFGVYDDDSLSEEYFSIISMIHCFSELNTKRISYNKYKCQFCEFCNSRTEVLNHIIESHQKEICTHLESHLHYIKSDKDYLEGMLTKLQFDRAIKRNKQPNYILQSNSNTIAPSLQAYESGSEESYDDFEEDFEIDINDNSNSDEAHSTFGIYYNSKYSSTFTKFIRKHSPTNSSSYDIFDLPIQSFNNINAGEQILLPIIDSYIQPNDFFRDSILSSFPEEEEISSKNRSKRKKRKPETISYLETIPKQYQQTIIQNISTNLIKKYIFTNCNQIIRTNLQAKKKQIQEQLLKEKEQRQRNEEKQRLIAMRERRKQKINEYSTKLQEPLIKTFIRNEIHNIYNEEIENNNSLYNLKNINLEYNNVVIVHGLVLRKHLNIEFLENAFNTLAFETDEDGNPKIRFIYYENRIMPLLFLANLDEVKKALSMSFGMFESSVVRLSRFDDSNGDEIIKLFTGQQIVKKIAKNFNEINENGGKNVLKEMSPIINLDK